MPKGFDPELGRGMLQREESDTRSKMRPDMMMVEMTAQEQRKYLLCAATHAAGMADLNTHMRNGRARRIWIVKGGY